MKNKLRLTVTTFAFLALALGSTLFLTGCDDDYYYPRPGYHSGYGAHSGSQYHNKKSKKKNHHQGHHHGKKKKNRW